MKILIADDDKMILEAVAHNLEGNGYEVLRADDGFQVLDIIEKEKVDLIISDVMMPNISGLGLLNLLRQFYLSRIPVIMISSLDKADIIFHSLGLGAVEFLSKPIDFDKLLRLVKTYDHKTA